MLSSAALILAHAFAPSAAFEPHRSGSSRGRGGSDATPRLTMAREDVGGTIDSGIGYLVSVQKEDGSWGDDAPKMLELGFALNTYRSWRLASHAISTMALAAVDETPESRAALAAAVRYMSTCELPLRDSDWDIDYVWTSLYGFVSCVELLGDPRLAEGGTLGELRAPLMARARGGSSTSS